jgi:hypothetical protein
MARSTAIEPWRCRRPSRPGSVAGRLGTDVVSEVRPSGAGDVAPSTQRAYELDWRAFVTWCQVRDVVPLPARPTTVPHWLADQEASSYAASTVDRRLFIIGRMHLVHGCTPPTRIPEVQNAWRRVRRRLGGAARKVAPITIDPLREMVDTCPPTPAGQRDHALLVVGFAAALRRSVFTP